MFQADLLGKERPPRRVLQVCRAKQPLPSANQTRSPDERESKAAASGALAWRGPPTAMDSAALSLPTDKEPDMRVRRGFLIIGVLWMMGGDSPWDFVSTFPTREECATAMRQQGQALEKMGLRVVASSAGASFRGRRCRPDDAGPVPGREPRPPERRGQVATGSGLEIRHRAAANVVIQDLTPPS